METIIQFTPAQVLAVCGAIVTLSACLGVLGSWLKKAMEPNTKQNERLDKIEQRLDVVDRILAEDNKRFQDFEEGNKVTMRALLALLAHGIDGNEIEGMREAKKELNDYLLKR